MKFQRIMMGMAFCFVGNVSAQQVKTDSDRSHQLHSLAYAENDKPIANPVWLDTVNVPYGGSVDVVMDFTNPVIKGASVFHCHLLNHEDKGMMAKILFE